MIAVEFAGQGVELGERGLGASRVAKGEGALEAGDGRGRQVQEHVVEQQDLLPQRAARAARAGRTDPAYNAGLPSLGSVRPRPDVG